MISGRTKVCALIGDPIEHSLSPALQNAAFQHLALDYVYVVFKVEKGELKDAMVGVRGLGLHGLNITMPHKIEVIKYLDELDETTKTVGSVNTILNYGGRLVGYTTDGIGALNALKYNGVDVYNKKTMILGAGGASRSLSFALAEEVKELVILNRTLEKAQQLANDLSSVLRKKAKTRAEGLNVENVRKELKDTDIVINATSVGMHPKENQTPIESDLLHPNLVVFDLVYEPLETRLIREARRIGAKTIDGLSMLVHQGAVSFEIWTGIKAPIEVMIKTAKKKLREGKN